MATQLVADMTVDELKTLIARELEQRMITWPRPYDPRTPQEILESMKHNRGTPPPGTPSVPEMIREDRDR